MSGIHPGLVILSAPSGAGKTTLCKRLLEEFSDSLELSISATTRAPRAGEKQGEHYYFITQKEFDHRVTQGRFAEWARVHGFCYGTLRDTVEDSFARGKSVLLDIDVQGAASLREAYPGRCFSVFIAPPSLAELKRRLEGRGTDSPAVIERRIQNAEDEMKRQDEFDEVLINDDLDKAY
ncbi:MAG TPA: guanylate kinase, partial [Bdellovibrionota bacterium]|nr:guanylate kinase [Bdellovibrionota bacterium]